MMGKYRLSTQITYQGHLGTRKLRIWWRADIEIRRGSHSSGDALKKKVSARRLISFGFFYNLKPKLLSDESSWVKMISDQHLLVLQSRVTLRLASRRWRCFAESEPRRVRRE
jgi:hypothetical protein